MKSSIKHLVECNCILPQFLRVTPTVFHRFVVFSIIDPDGSVKPSYAECNNCGAIHRVREVGKSAQIAKESTLSLPKISELRTAIPEDMAKILESYKCDITTWQELKFILDEKDWGKSVILAKEEDQDMVVGKVLVVLGTTLFKVETFSVGDGDE